MPFQGNWSKEDCVLLFPTAYRMDFGQPSTKNYASITNATSSSVSEFTMCLFVRMKDTNFSVTVVASASTVMRLLEHLLGMPSTFVCFPQELGFLYTPREMSK